MTDKKEIDLSLEKVVLPAPEIWLDMVLGFQV
jgi:hypothetical protein